MISRVHRAPGVAGFTQSLSLKILRPAHYRALLPWSVVALASLFASMASMLIAELKGADDVLAAHVSAGIFPDVVLKTLCNSLSERTRNTWVKDVAMAEAISDAVAAGPWPPSQKKRARIACFSSQCQDRETLEKPAAQDNAESAKARELDDSLIGQRYVRRMWNCR